jgi:predicted permease
VRAYRWWLRLLPRQFRARRGEELIAAAEEEMRAAAERGPSARVRAAAGLATDVVASAWSLRWGRLAADVVQDARYAGRALRRSPGFTLVAVLTLAVGIAANTTVFSLVNAFYLVPSEFPDPARLVVIAETSVTELCSGCGVGTSYPGFVEWRDRAGSFERMAACLEEDVVLSAPFPPQRVPAARVSAALFDVLDVRPVEGRAFRPADDRPGAPPTVILGHATWVRLFGGDPAAVGRVVRVNGVPAEIVGVMPAGLAFPSLAQLWLPLHVATPSASRADRDVEVVARLRPEVTIAAARAEMRAIASAEEQAHPDTQKNWSADVRTLQDDRRAEGGPPMLTMLGAVGLVLAVACTNLAALVLARSAGRRRELAVRAALGAGRARLVRQMMAESLVLGGLGGVMGLLMSLWGVQLAASRLSDPVPYFIRVTVDWRVMAFCGAAAILTGLLVGLAPAMVATRPDLTTSLKQGSASAGTPRRHARLRSVLISAELALVLILLCGAALMGQSFLRMLDRPRGYDMTGLTLAQVPLAGPRFSDERALSVVLDDLGGRLDAVPDARMALSHTHFLRGFGADARVIRVDGWPAVPPGASPSFAFAVSPGFFETQGLRVLGGRPFDGRDRSGSAPIVIVNQELAEAVWPGRSPLGARVQLPLPAAPDVWWTVVGVVSNMEGEAAGAARVQAFLYVPLAQLPGRPVDVLIRSTRDQASMLQEVRAAIAQVNPDEPLTDIRSAEEEHARQYWFVGYFAMFYLAFAAFALLLAVVGVYGVVAQAIGERTREFGIRIALGADRARLYRLVLGHTLTLTAAGVVFGLAGAAASTRFLGWLLFGASPTDPLIFGGSALALAATALVASWVPARRVAHLDPVRALKGE